MVNPSPVTGGGADFLQYLQSADAQLAPLWQLAALARLRRALNRPLSDRQYCRLRAALPPA